MKTDTKPTFNEAENGNKSKILLVAVEVAKGVKYELTYIPIDWVCPNCKAENNTTLIEEVDLNHSQDNTDKCRKCNKQVVIKASDIYCINKSFEQLDEESRAWFQDFKKFNVIKKQDNIFDIASVRLLNLLTANRDHLEINIVKRNYLPISELSKMSLTRFSKIRKAGPKTVWELKAICYYAQINLKL